MHTYFDRALVLSVRLVYMDLRRRAYRELAGSFIEGHRNEVMGIRVVCGLEDVVRRIEDDKGGAGYVGLGERMEISNGGRSCRGRWAGTRICLSFQKPVVRAWILR